MKRLLLGLASLLALGSALPALAADTTRPTVGLPSPTQATAGAAVTISATVTDTESGIASCNLYVDNDDVGSMSVSGTTASISYAFAQAGIHTMFVFCRDNANNFNSGANASVTVSTATGSGDSTPPSVGLASPPQATVDTAVTISASVSDTGTGVVACQLIVNGFSAGTMTISGGTASRAHTFDNTGTYTVLVQCSDVAGNTGNGLAVTVNVAVASQVPPPALQSELVKLACPAGAAADHYCKAVYFRDTDGKRHAFPNSKVYFSWYEDFSAVKEISANEMSSYPLGEQVTYRPGTKLVKFTTLNSVYAVSRGGVLRWVKTEALATSLYGAEWSKNVDDIPDTFYTAYTFGADINLASDFVVATERASAITIDQNF